MYLNIRLSHRALTTTVRATTAAFLNQSLPLRVLIGIMPCVIRIGAIAILTHLAMLIRAVFTTAPTARRILTTGIRLVVICLSGLSGLIRPIGWAHVCGEGFLARDASVVIMVVVAVRSRYEAAVRR